MSKTLYIIRHAKASREEIYHKDWQRPLLPIGIERANKVSKILKRKNIVPDKIISSHAFRALNTAVIFALNLDYPADKIEISYTIYGKTPDDLISLIREQKDDITSLMIFGHNPSFTDLCNILANENRIDLTTSSVACIRFNTGNWMKIEKKQGKIAFLETGK